MNYITTTKKLSSTLALVAILWLLGACGNSKPEPIKLNVDNCDHCKMTITNNRFAAEIITVKGRAYKFDDILCMTDYAKAHADATKDAAYYVADFLKATDFIEASKAFYIKGENIKSPMGGNMAAFASKEQASEHALQQEATIISWNDINK